jgi:spore coat protein U-like protein
VNRLSAGLGAVALLAATSAHAVVTCYVRQAGTVLFTAYDATSRTPNDASLAIVIGCDRDGGPASVSVEVALGASAVSGAVAIRQMRQVGGAGDLLRYNLYRDSGRSAVWGSTSGLDTSVQTIPNVPNKGSATITFTIYGRINTLQDVSPGTYSDALQVTVNP